MANQDITFNFNEISSDTYFLVQNVDRSILPSIIDRLVAIPGRNAPYDFGSEYKDREIKIDVVYQGTDLTNLRGIVRKLAEWLNPLDGSKTLVFSDEPTLSYEAKLTGDTDIEQIICTGKGTLTFTCVDLFAGGAEQTQTIAGMPKVENDIDTTAEFQNVISASNIQYGTNSVLLSKEGTNYTKSQDNFSTGGTYSNTTTDSNNDLILGSVQTPHNDPYNIDYSTGTFNGSIHDPFLNKLVMENLPDFNSNYLDYMDAVDTVTDWQTFTDPADPGTVTFTQNTGYYTMSALNMDGALRQLSGTFTFPLTVDFVYRIATVNTGSANPTRVDARVVFGGKMYAASLGNTGGAWKLCRIVAHNATQADFYINGVRQGSLTPLNTSLSDRVQFFIDQAWQGVLDLSYFGMISAALTTYQQPSYTFPTVATYTSNDISLDGTSDVYTNSVITFTKAVGTIDSGAFDSSVVVEADVYKNGAWQGYQTVTSGSSLPYITANDELRGVKTRFRVHLQAYGLDVAGNTPNISPIALSVDGQISDYSTSGSFTADVDTNIQQVGKAVSTSITWSDELPFNTTVTCSVSLNGGAFTPVTKGGSIPGITSTTDLSAATLQVKFDLTTVDTEITPKVFNYSFSLVTAFKDQGERVGADYLNLSTLPDIGESYIGWDTTPDGTQDIEVYVEVTDQPAPTGSWTQVTTNPSSIPGITPGDNTLLNKRVFSRQILKSPTKATSPILNRVLYSVSGQGGGNIVYNGTADSYPLITIDFLQDIVFDDAPFQVLHIQTGNKLIFNSDFTAGLDTLVIDCVKGSVKLNGVHAMNLLAIQSNYLYFVKGQNDFEILPEDSASVNFVWKERFL